MDKLSLENKQIIGLFVVISLIIISVSISLFFILNDETNPSITLATTTSTDNSGLLDYVHPLMTKDTGVNVNIVPLGTGAALEYGRKGLVDVVIVHARSLEDEFINEGYGIHRVDLMYNDFIIIGPSDDPAQIKGLSDNTDIFQALHLARNNIKFISRGDNSGTHVKELNLWKSAGITINSDDFQWANDNSWYMETGSGMGSTLTITSELKNAYTLSDRGTWLFQKVNLDNLENLAEGPESWHNPYGAILVNPAKFNSGLIKLDLAKKYVKWLISTTGQSMIDDYVIEGEKAFFADFKSHLNEMTLNEIEFWGITKIRTWRQIFLPRDILKKEYF
ncbi:MAG: substrate-binding domain-containing protein [Candidatus Hodarchaeales archaeon]|jgi:tungstate transport system substrate-binding protein